MQLLTTQTFAHHEDGAGIRHPGVVIINLLMAIWLLYLMVFTRNLQWTHYMLLWSMFWLYCCSSTYHWVRAELTARKTLVRFFDQTAISWMILAMPIPFVPEATPVLVMLAGCNAANKWRDYEGRERTSCLIFLSFGILSSILILAVGLPRIDVQPFSLDTKAILIWVAIIAFVGKLWIYRRRKFCLIPNVWEPAESGHLSCAIGVWCVVQVITTMPVS